MIYSPERLKLCRLNKKETRPDILNEKQIRSISSNRGFFLPHSRRDLGIEMKFDRIPENRNKFLYFPLSRPSNSICLTNSIQTARMHLDEFLSSTAQSARSAVEAQSNYMFRRFSKVFAHRAQKMNIIWFAVGFCVTTAELELHVLEGDGKSSFPFTTIARFFLLVLTEQLFPISWTSISCFHLTHFHRYDSSSALHCAQSDIRNYLHKIFAFPTPDRSSFCDHRQQKVQRLCVAETSIYNICHSVDWILEYERYGKMKL